LIIHVLLEIFYIQLGGNFLGLDICETIQSYSIFSSKRLGKLGWSYVATALWVKWEDETPTPKVGDL
jgi:hypothetical protein